MPYSFDTVLLSAAKTGFPNLIGTQLSAFGVNTISLSTNDKGIAFNKRTPVGTGVNVNIRGSVFFIDDIYQGSQLAIAKVPVDNISTYTIYTHNSSLAVAPASALIVGDTDTMDADSRRKWVLGYI
jgi:hypothetical protein